MAQLAKPETQMLSVYPKLRFIPFFHHFGYDRLRLLSQKLHSLLQIELEEHKKS